MPQHLVLGLDLQIDGCGWALLDLKGERVVDAGVRLWTIPRDPKTKASNTQIRHMIRSNRRNIKRNRDRKKHCLACLAAEGLVPAGEGPDWLQTRAGDESVLDLRAAGLDRRLTDREWAQVLYNLCARRGHIPHGKTTEGDDGMRVLYAIRQNTKALDAGGFRTVGELFAQDGRSRNHGDEFSHSIANGQVAAELDELFCAQRRLGNLHAGDAFEEAYRKVFGWMADVAEHDAQTYASVAPCRYLPSERRVALACPTSERVRAWERLGAVEIVSADGVTAPLPHEMRARAVEVLFAPERQRRNTDGKVRYSELRKWLALPEGATFARIEPETESKLEPFIPRCWRAARKGLSPELMERLADDRDLADDVFGALAYANSEKSLRGRVAELGLALSPEEVDQLCELDFPAKAFTGYGQMGRSALRAVEAVFASDVEVRSLDGALAVAGLTRAEAGLARGNKLPPYAEWDPTMLNPVTLRAFGQMRHIVNAVCATYGMPDEIRLELASELKRSPKEERQIALAERVRTRRTEEAAARVAAELRLDDPSDPEVRSRLELAQLFDEQGGVDVYTGESIDFARLVTEPGYCVVDHVLPYARSCENGRMNRVLCLRASARAKRGMSPYEWILPQGDEAWEAFCTRIAGMEGYPARKKTHLTMTSFRSGERAIAERNCTDTRWLTRQARDYLEQNLRWERGEAGSHVTAVSSAARTALERAWSIDADRASEPLHRAVRAACIAVCDTERVKAVAGMLGAAWLLSDDAIYGFAHTLPWASFEADVVAARDAAVPTRLVPHKMAGRLFEDTVYRFDGPSEDGQFGLLALRKGDVRPSRNFVEREDGSALKRAEMACLRLWFDPKDNWAGHAGRWLSEPLYYADLPQAFEPDYTPLVSPNTLKKPPRDEWEPLRVELRSQTPLVLFHNDPIMIDGKLRRFGGYNISTAQWKLFDPLGVEDWHTATRGNSLASIDGNTEFYVVREDVLGLCYKENPPEREQFDDSDGLGE